MADEFAPASQIIDVDPLTNTTQRMTITPDQQLILETTTNIDDVARMNAEQANSVSRTSRSGDMVHVARLPMLVYLDLAQRGVLYDKRRMRKWLLSEEARPYRTHHYAS